MAKSIFDTDIAVVGAGGCGLTAALVAAERGKRVILLERASTVGGSTAMSAGIFIAARSRLQLANGENGTAEELAADILHLNVGQSDSRVTQALCHVSGPLMDWLVDQDVPLEHMPTYRYPGMSRSWIISSPQRHGRVITEALLHQVVQKPNIDLHLNTKVTGLRTDAGVVNGLEAVTSTQTPMPGDKKFTINAQAVILAASGFGANQSLVRRYIPDLADAPYFGAPFATGDAIRWGQSLGAAVDHMSAFQSHGSIAYPEKMLVTTYLINHGAIQVNRFGLRFGDETDSYAGHALAIQSQPGNTVVEVFDERILRQTLADYPRFRECLDAGIVRRAESLTSLAQQFDLPEDNLAATITAYNQAGRTGRDPFGRTHFAGPLAPPYCGIRVTSALVQTLGGLRVDEWARVLKAVGEPVPGLFAGGGTAAGLAGDRPEGYLAGAGLLAAFGLGWIAGFNATNE